MRKKRWKKVLIWTASIIVVLGVGGLFAANYVMDRMIAQLSASLEDELFAVVPDDAVKPSGTGGDDGNQAAPNDSNESDTDDQDLTDDQPENANQPGGQPAGSSTSSGIEYSAEVSADKAKDVQEKITVGEKAKLASVFLKQLSADDIQKLQSLASGGLNTSEKKEARTLILDRLTPEQYNDLIQIAKKYGMSQGKSYEEVSKEK